MGSACSAERGRESWYERTYGRSADRDARTRARRHKMVPALASALLLPALAGCGSSVSSPKPTANPTEQAGPKGAYNVYKPSAALLPTCAHTGKPIALPVDFPKQFPLPKGSAITGTSKQFGAVVVNGFVPTKKFATSLTFFMSELPAAGFRIGDHDAEPPREGEGAYVGHGYIGRFKIHSIPGCTSALTFQASARSSKPAK